MAREGAGVSQCPTGDFGLVFANRFRLVEFIARGGMGAVYRGHDSETDGVVAIKVLEDDAESPIARRRFFNEAAMASKITHPNVVRIVDYGVDGDLCYIAMEYIEGISLGTWLPKHSKLPIDDALSLLEQICAGLAEAHDNRFVHRDLKPSNIMIVGPREAPVAKLLDFGLAKRTERNVDLTRTGTLLGTPTYMSPEQVRGGEIGPETDVYNAGLVLWRLVTGRTLFRYEDVSATLVAHLTEPVPLLGSELGPHVPEVVEWLVQTALAKQAAKRFANARELGIAVRAARERMAGREGTLILRGAAVLESEISARSQVVVEPPMPEWVKPVIIGLVAVVVLLVMVVALMASILVVMVIQ